MPATEGNTRSTPQLSRPAKSASFSIDHQQLGRCYRSEVDIQPGHVVVPSGLAQTTKRAEISLIRAGRTDKEECQVRHGLPEHGCCQSIVFAVESQECPVELLAERWASLTLRLDQMMAVSRSIQQVIHRIA